MLNFTYKSGEVLGQFNGRFVFRGALDSTELPLATFQGLSTGEESAWSDEVLRHEYFHWKVFRRSKVGIQIIGRRFAARNSFVGGGLKAVKDYYVARTCYFFYAYRIHEKVTTILESKSDEKPNASIQTIAIDLVHAREIASADAKAQQLIVALHVNRSRFERVKDYLLGNIATREYGLQSYFADDKKRVRLYETSVLSATRGVLNSAFSSEQRPKYNMISLLKTFRRRMNTEGRIGGLTKERMAVWAAIKFQAELYALREIYALKLKRPERAARMAELRFIKDYKATVAFILRHILKIPDRLYITLVLNLIMRCAKEFNCEKSDSELIDDLCHLDEEILYFFYTHGN